MGVVEVVLVLVGVFGLGYGVDTTVDYMKHKRTLEVDTYSACVQYAKSVKECRNLE